MPRLVQVDMTKTPTGFEPLPAGSYEATVLTVTEAIARSSGKPMLKWAFQVIEDGFTGRRAWMNTSLQPQALFVLKRNLMALGWTKEELSGQLDLDLDDLIGVQCTIVMVDDIDQNGNPRTNIDRLLPAGQSSGPKVSASVTSITSEGLGTDPLFDN